MPKLSQYTKAIIALATTFAATYQVADADHVIVGYEWRAIIIASIVAGVLTWAVPNSGGPPAPPV
jgi:hypothetical protein